MNEKNNRDIALQKYAAARSNLLVMVCFTLVNIVLLFLKADVMMLFSATVPYFAAMLGLVDESGLLLVPGILIAAIGLIVCFLCWLLSKKNYGWMIAALVLFILDTAALIGLYIWTGDFSGILDLAIHIWVLYYLIVGVKYGKQLKNMPEEVPEVQMEQPPESTCVEN